MSVDAVVYRIPGMEAVERQRDLVYRRLEDGTEGKMDVFLPPGLAEGERRPGVVFIHGGPLPPHVWPTVKDWEIFVSYGRLLAASGLVAATFSHRYLGFPDLPDSAEWVSAAIGFLRNGAESFHLDPDRLAVWAFSAGGPHLGPLLTDKPSWARCLLGFYTVLDIRSVREDLPSLTEEAANRFSPVACLPASGYDGPPVLIARAGLDRPVLNGTVDAFVAQALAANVELDLLNHPRGHHGFDARDDDERSREIIARAIAFVKAHA